MVGRFPLPLGASDLIAVENEVVDHGLRNYQARMGLKQGVKFDKAFVSDQLHEHVCLLNKAQVFQRHASAAMRPLLD